MKFQEVSIKSTISSSVFMIIVTRHQLLCSPPPSSSKCSSTITASSYIKHSSRQWTAALNSSTQEHITSANYKQREEKILSQGERQKTWPPSPQLLVNNSLDGSVQCWHAVIKKPDPTRRNRIKSLYRYWRKNYAGSFVVGGFSFFSQCTTYFCKMFFGV